MANVRTPRGAWIEAAFAALAAGGPDAVRIEALAARLGVSKGGFYWHFKDRKALLFEMLDAWEQTVVEDVITRIDAGPADPRAKLRALFDLAVAFAQSPDALGVEPALRDWARRDGDVATRLVRVDNRRMDYLRSLFGQFCMDADDTEARSMLAFSLFVGTYFIAADHGERTRQEVLALALERLLDASWPP